MTAKFRVVLVVLLAMLLPASVLGQISIPNTFTANTVADPDDVNANFTALSVAVDRTGGTLTGNLSADANVTIDGVDISDYLATVVLAQGNGSASAPAFAVVGDPDNGMFLATTNSIAFAVAGTEYQRATATGDVAFGAAVTAAEHIEVEDGDATTVIQISNTATDGDPALAFALSGTKTFTMGVDDGDGDIFKIGTTAIGTNTRFAIDGSGFIGFGTTAPDGGLHIFTATAGSVTATTTADELTIESNADAGISILTDDASLSRVILGNEADNLAAQVEWDPASDLLSIGTVNAGADLSINTGDDVPAMTISDAGLIATVSTAADSLDVAGGAQFGTGAVSLIGADGKINGPLSTTNLDDLSGANLTTLNGSNISSGTVALARLPTSGTWTTTFALSVTSLTVSGAISQGSGVIVTSGVTSLADNGTLTVSSVASPTGTLEIWDDHASDHLCVFKTRGQNDDTAVLIDAGNCTTTQGTNNSLNAYFSGGSIIIESTFSTTNNVHWRFTRIDN